MSVITDQCNRFSEDYAVLRKIRAETFASQVMQVFQGTDISLLAIELTANDKFIIGPGSSQNIIIGEEIRSGIVYHEDDNKQFDPTEHGNAGLIDFLELGIEWNTWVDILNEILTNIQNIVALYSLQGEKNQVVFTTDKGHWTVATTPDDEEELA